MLAMAIDYLTAKIPLELYLLEKEVFIHIEIDIVKFEGEGFETFIPINSTIFK